MAVRIPVKDPKTLKVFALKALPTALQRGIMLSANGSTSNQTRETKGTAMKTLVISSEMDILHLLEVKLGKEGYEVFSARTGDDGLDQARQEQPEVIILDPQVPGEHGMGLVNRLKKEIEPAPVVIVLSPNVGTADIGAAFTHGADDFVGVPFSPQGLIERLHIALVRAGRLRAESEGA